MKKYVVLGLGLCTVLAFASCKSSESAYKKAYDKAKSGNYQANTNNTPVQVSPVNTTPVTTDNSANTSYVDNAPVRQEKVTVVSGSGLRDYNVVCGSFSLQTNAEGLQRRLSSAGYPAQIAYNAGNNMYRVIATTYSDKASAVQSRDALRGTYPDAWLLYSK